MDITKVTIIYPVDGVLQTDEVLASTVAGAGVAIASRFEFRGKKSKAAALKHLPIAWQEGAAGDRHKDDQVEVICQTVKVW